ncbi:hypothetical protein TeGR_g10436 [Tetraparma gracilis]|uniref:Sialate O-acetylesterase domain-containing protein n=1 Tax=Tetraparma gracilis TaxID=2962635 RepID=A0ABQ6M9H5_9STRA|nr:hypothetical protein TeGR_g10436 [Tetraparma gracilis]
MQELSTIPRDRIGVFLGYGQSNSECYSSRGPGTYCAQHSASVYEYSSGSVSPMQSSGMATAAAGGGCVYGRLGDMLVATGAYDAVVFATAGVGAANLWSLMPGRDSGRYERFRDMFLGMEGALGRVDGVLWHQGEADRKNDVEEYRKNFVSLAEAMESDGVVCDLYIAQASACKGEQSPELLEVQRELAETLVRGREGPNTDRIGEDLRTADKCHFSSHGLDIMAAMWADILLDKTLI